MIDNIKKFIIMALFTITFAIPLESSEDVDFADSPAEIKSMVWMIVPGTGEAETAMKNWLFIEGREKIYEWSRARGLFLSKKYNRTSVLKAGYPDKFGSTVVFSGLSRNRRYFFWVDFLKFDNISVKAFPYKIDILIGDRDRGFTLLKSITAYDASSGICKIDLPYSEIAGGRVEIMLRDNAYGRFFWGVGFMALTDVDQVDFESYLKQRSELKQH